MALILCTVITLSKPKYYCWPYKQEFSLIWCVLHLDLLYVRLI